ncbi:MULTISPECIES: Na+/H+ antiporter subunit E [Nocardia]|uniref:Na+/H+ antiporter subunit E n=1 Tax=Nocardia TaxID=1817 RepID=UPI0007EBC52C|nr:MULTISPECIES: Na+/H+ antiporter subunit E [Nocardia]OBF70837.1 hypothetical protein A9X06_30820 [Mycobacterium sp. 852002-51759_SCH5129042]MBF6277537.1 Na+/H+ antiporter subunit E [Nocardia nova]MBV7707987.1 Na+/H+ antiporter subunit E [Nocardia nova]OBA45007.1 hypothetical protein A5789_08185 [Nocardia sp. 852002-51101_SCH5132738]OBB32849.1 hypothetical protein A5748_08080 [Nocardia sp. 852002-51244_SCH5132740]
MRRGGVVAEAAAWWLICVLIWQATVTVAAWEELIAAAVPALPCAVAACAARRAVGGSWRPPARLPRWVARTALTVVRDGAGALALVARGRRPAGRFIELPLPATGSTAQRDGREAAATILLSATPGSLVVYSDPEHSRIRLHTLPLPESALQRAVRDPDRRR